MAQNLDAADRASLVTSMYALLQFDGELMFHNDRHMCVEFYIDAPSEHLNSAILEDGLEYIKTWEYQLFWEYALGEVEEIDPSFEIDDWDDDYEEFEETFDFDRVIFALQKHRIDCVRLLEEYTDRHINSYAIVDAEETLFKILKFHDVISLYTPPPTIRPDRGLWKQHIKWIGVAVSGSPWVPGQEFIKLACE